MRNLLNKYLTGASMIALTFSLNTSTANATCSAMPTCDELGYTQTSCPSGVTPLKCPFDESKYFCGAAINCDQLGYTKYKSCDSSTQETLYCPFDKSYRRCLSFCNPQLYNLNEETSYCDPSKGPCICCEEDNNNYCMQLNCYEGYEYDPVQRRCTNANEFKVGQTIYYNGDKNKILGTVYKITPESNGQYRVWVVAVNYWHTAAFIASLDDWDTCTNGFINGQDGKYNTQKGLQNCSGTQMPALQAAYEYKPSYCGENSAWQISAPGKITSCGGKHQWWLPSQRELEDMWYSSAFYQGVLPIGIDDWYGFCAIYNYSTGQYEYQAGNCDEDDEACRYGWCIYSVSSTPRNDSGNYVPAIVKYQGNPLEDSGDPDIAMEVHPISSFVYDPSIFY